MAEFPTPTARYGGITESFQAGQSAAQKLRLDEEEALRRAREQAVREQESAARIGLLQAQESRQAAAFAEQQKRAAALRAAMSESIPEEPTSIVRGPAAAGGIPGLRVPARRSEEPPSVPGISVAPPSAPSGGITPPMYLGAGDVTPPTGGFSSTEAARAALLREQQALSTPAKIGAAVRYLPTLGAAVASDIARPIVSPIAATGAEFLSGLRGAPAPSVPTPAEDEAALTAEAAAAGLTPPAPSAAEEVARTPVDKPVEVADVGRRLYTLEKAQVARARKELSAQRKEVVRAMKLAQAAEDITAYNNARLLLLKIDGQIEDKNRVDQLLTFRDSTGTKTLEPLAKQLNELTDGRVEIEALEDGTFNLYDNGTDSEIPFTPKPLTREELWNQLDLAFNNDRIAKEQAAITAQAEAQAKLSEEYAKAMGKGEAERQLDRKYPQADYAEGKTTGGTTFYYDRKGVGQTFEIEEGQVVGPDKKPVLDADGQPIIARRPKIIQGLTPVIPGWNGPMSTQGIPIQ